MSVLGLIVSFSPYLRYAMLQFPMVIQGEGGIEYAEKLTQQKGGGVRQMLTWLTKRRGGLGNAYIEWRGGWGGNADIG